MTTFKIFQIVFFPVEFDTVGCGEFFGISPNGRALIKAIKKELFFEVEAEKVFDSYRKAHIVSIADKGIMPVEFSSGGADIIQRWFMRSYRTETETESVLMLVSESGIHEADTVFISDYEVNQRANNQQTDTAMLQHQTLKLKDGKAGQVNGFSFKNKLFNFSRILN